MAYHDDEFNKLPEDRLKHPTLTQFRNPYPAPNSRAVNKNPWKLTRRQTKSLVWLATIYFLLIGMLFGSWGTAYAAMDSLPNDPLYSVKLIGEDLQLLLTSDTTARISLLTTFANRRADEATILAWQGEPIPEQVTALIDEYQDEIASLSANLDEVSLEGEPESEGNYQRPQDRDNEQGGELVGDNAGTPSRNAYGDPNETTLATVDLEILDPAISITGTVDISGTMNMTQTRAGESHGPGHCVTPGFCASLGEDHRPGPFTYSYSDSDDDVAPPYTPGFHEGYGPGFTSDIPQQSPTSSQPVVNKNVKQPTENKGNKP